MIQRCSYLLLVSLIFFSPNIFSTQALSANLEQIVTTAETAFLGTCLERRVEMQNGLLVTRYVFRVGQWLKGTPQKREGEVFEFVQVGATREEAVKMNMPFFVGVVPLEPTQEYFLFLTKRNASTGLSSPIGLHQGVFDVVVQPNGTKSVTSKFLSSSLLEGLSQRPGVQKSLTTTKTASSNASSPIPLDNFLDLVNVLQESSR